RRGDGRGRARLRAGARPRPAGRAVLATVKEPMEPTRDRLEDRSTGMSQVRTLQRPDEPAGGAVRARPRLSSWSMRLPARWARAVLWQILLEPFVRTFYDLRAVGLDRLEQVPGPVIFAANHCAHLDNGFIIMALPWRWRRRLAIAA